ncbi:helix-turn-helix domain-containing protein [Ralstonia mannitolilytica]|uniref:helix-turn-helix domain-containing protein n=1 Tax=Ralstonia mannitolilytica TaxID=105219 RepID=UPI0026EA04C5|nr:helix-turn-helix domain-containing protein [Ralstonia mannitolilytica]
MSTIIMSLCWPLQMPPTPKAVLISLADNANDQGVCWPSIPTICKRTCFSERAVRDAIKWLEEAHALRADRSTGRSTSYTVTPGDYDEAVSHPGSTCRGTPAGDATPANGAPRQEMPGTPAGGAAPPRQEMPEPRQEVPPNRKEPSLEPSGNRKKKASADDVLGIDELVAEGVDAQHAKDWLTARKAKRLPLTPSAWSMTKDEAAAAGLTPAQAVAAAIRHGWAGFKAEWWRRTQPATTAPRAGPPQKFDPVAYVNRNRQSPSNDQPDNIIDVEAKPVA